MICDSIRRLAEQKIGEWGRAASRVSHGSTWISASGGKPVQPFVVHEVSAHLEVVIFDYPGESVAEGCQVLALLTIRVPVSAAVERCEGGAVGDHGVAVSLELIGPYDRAVRINSILIEANAGQEAPQRGVAVAENELAIKAAAGFIDEVVANRSQIRKRKGMGPLVLLSQP